jgi:hypothetical protein
VRWRDRRIKHGSWGAGAGMGELRSLARLAAVQVFPNHSIAVGFNRPHFGKDLGLPRPTIQVFFPTNLTRSSQEHIECMEKPKNAIIRFHIQLKPPPSPYHSLTLSLSLSLPPSIYEGCAHTHISALFEFYIRFHSLVLVLLYFKKMKPALILSLEK